MQDLSGIFIITWKGVNGVDYLFPVQWFSDKKALQDYLKKAHEQARDWELDPPFLKFSNRVVIDAFDLSVMSNLKIRTIEEWINTYKWGVW